jgi:hypothetical protein
MEIDSSLLHRGSMQKVDVVTTETDTPVPLYFSRKAVLDEIVIAFMRNPPFPPGGRSSGVSPYGAASQPASSRGIRHS